MNDVTTEEVVGNKDTVTTKLHKGPPIGGSRGGNDNRDRRHDGNVRPIENARLGLWLFMAAVFMLFIGLTGGYLVLRFQGGSWPPPGIPPLPAGLWANTIILLLSSITMAWAHRSINRGDGRGLSLGLLVTTLLGVAFLVRQVIVWRELRAIGIDLGAGVYGSVFYIFTGVHAAHIIGGLVFLSFILAQSWRGHYSESKHTGVELCGLYWHFMDALWIYLFTILYLV